MKRCPECQFLYENEAIKCDMDGTPLRYTVALPSLPGLAKSIWDKWTIALLCAVVLGTVLVILYRGAPPAFTSSSGAQTNSANEERRMNQNVQPSETASPSESSATEQSGDASATPDRPSDAFEFQETPTAAKAQKSKRATTLADDNQPTPAPVNHFEPASNPPAPATSVTAAKPTTTEAVASEKSAAQKSPQTTSSAAASAGHAKPPADYSNKPASQNQKKDSGFKSLFKKAGQALKKPFGEN
jgi:hypothetical protein